MIKSGTASVNWDEVPEVKQTILCRAFIKRAEQMFDLMQTNPDLNAEFEAWQKSRNH